MPGLAVLLAGLAVGVWWALRPRTGRPSVVLIMVDTLRADFLGSYGFQGAISPNLDALASESVLFESCSSQAPWTKPSVASLFTALYPQTHRVLTHAGRYGGHPPAGSSDTTHTDALPEAALTLAEVLRDAGYRTGAFVANPWIQRDLGFAQGFQVFHASLAGNNTPAGPILEAASRWLDSSIDAGPFFLFLHLMDTHGPYDAPDTDYAAVRPSPSLGMDRPLTNAELQAIPPYMLSPKWIWAPESRRLRTWRGRYAAGVRALDRRLGPFLADLHESGVADRSLVVFTSDHGEELCEHSGWDHGDSLYEHQLRVPLMIRRPRGLGGGERIAAPVLLIDLMPTILGLVGVEPPPDLQGRDLAGLVLGKAPPPEAEATVAAGVKWQPHLCSLLSEQHKLIADLSSGEASLFDLGSDPGEEHDLAQSQPALLDELKGILRDRLRRITARPGLQPDSVEINQELQRRLEALGYLERPTPPAGE